MGRWEWPAVIGVIGGALLFLSVLVPSVVIQFRRYGALNAARILGVGAISVYVVALFAYTLLPLPERTQAWCDLHGYDGANLVPFAFIDDIRRETAGLGLRATLLSFATLQVVFNVVLFIPFGMFVRRFFGRGVLVATLSGAAVSLAIELTQYTGIWGLYPCSYRYGDVDDLMTNTLGALIGASIAWIVLGWMPSSERLQTHRLTPRPVTRTRRTIAMSLDVIVCFGLGLSLVVGYRVARYLGDPEFTAADSPVGVEAALQYLVPAVVVLYVPALIRRGASLGQRIVWLAPHWPRGQSWWATLWRRLVRASVPGGLALGLAWWSSAGQGREWWSLAAVLLVLASFVSVLFSPRGISYVVSGGRVVDARVPFDELDTAFATVDAPPAEEAR